MTTFNSIDNFIAALNDYDGDNIWYEFIYAAKIKNDKIDSDKTSETDGEIYFKSGQVILYHGVSDFWG